MHFLTHLLQWFKSHCCDPKFLPRPNLPLHLISSTSREATPYICDPRGPHQSPKMTKNTTQIDAISVAPFKEVKDAFRRRPLEDEHVVCSVSAQYLCAPITQHTNRSFVRQDALTKSLQSRRYCVMISFLSWLTTAMPNPEYQAA